MALDFLGGMAGVAVGVALIIFRTPVARVQAEVLASRDWVPLISALNVVMGVFIVLIGLVSAFS
jgi:hypothetical protein